MIVAPFSSAAQTFSPAALHLFVSRFVRASSTVDCMQKGVFIFSVEH